MKKIISLLLVFVLFASFSHVFAEENNRCDSHQLKVLGNRLVYADDESVEVHLTGVNTCGSEWMANPESERVKRAVKEAICNWDANLIRLGVSTDGWWGRYSYVSDGGYQYRSYIEDVITMVQDSGKYIILDLHEYNYVSVEHARFWREAAEMFGNNPAVLFGLLNEPCGSTTWETWRNGDGGDNFGEQPLVEMIRDLGAKNIIVAGGIGYSGSLTSIGIENGYDLTDCGSGGDTSKAGYGVMYDAHIYPAHGQTASWHSKFASARKRYPLLIGEFGWDPNDKVIMGNSASEESENYHTRWFPEIYDWFEDDITYGSKANWTAWCFHPSSSPAMLEKYDKNGVEYHNDDYVFTPTECFGSYIKSWLINERGEDILAGKEIVSFTKGRPADSTEPILAIDGDKATAWKCANVADKSLVIDLGAVYNINRWQVYHKNTLLGYSLWVSLDGETWTEADSHVTDKSDISDKYFKTVPARYVKLFIDDAKAVSEIYDFRVIADNKSDGLIYEGGAADTSGAVLHEISYDFYNGQSMPCWWSSGTMPEYTENASEDKKGSVMHFADSANRMMALQSFTNTAGYSYFEYKYKSNYNVSVYFSLDYRVSDKKTLSTKTFTLPSTDGQWRIVRITPEELMPSESDTWVKTDLATLWSGSGSNFEPVLLSYMKTNTDGYADFEYFKAVWTMKGNFSFESVRALQNGLESGSLRMGKADFYLRYNNQEEKKLKNMLAAVAVYDSERKLAAISLLPFNAAANIRTSEHKLTVDVPSDGCTAKIITWNTADNMLPVTDVVEF